MKILLIHNKYGDHSGEESVVNLQKQLLQKNGMDVVTYFRRSSEIDSMAFGRTKAFVSGIYGAKSIEEIKKLIAKENPDIVHIHNLFPFISPAILPIIKKMGVPIVMTVHNYRLMCPNGLFFNKGKICEKCTTNAKELNCVINNCEKSFFKSLGYASRNYWARKNRFFLNNIDAYLCLTNFQKKKLISNGYPESKITVVPNFYNIKKDHKTIEVSNKKYVAFVGRLSPEKGISLLLKAATQLPHIQFHLAGKTRDSFELETKLPKNITLRGMLNQKEMNSFYSKALFLVQPSICYEGFPMVFPEAMAHKLAIIAPNMGGFPEITENNYNGLLFKPFSVNSLINAIEKLWSNPILSKELGQNGFKKVQEKYSSETYFNQMASTYIDLQKTK